MPAGKTTCTGTGDLRAVKTQGEFASEPSDHLIYQCLSLTRKII